MKRFFAHPLKLSGMFILIFGLNLAPVLSAHSQPSSIADTLSETIDLEQAIQIALANNTQMKRSLLSVRDADQQILGAWSNVMPDIAASANYTRNLEVPVNFIPAIIFDQNADPDELIPVAFGTDNNWMGGFTVSQTIFNGQAFVGISSSELVKAAQAEGMRATAQGIVTQTRITYYQALVTKERLRLIEAQISRIRKSLEDTRKLAEQGFVDEYALLQLEVQLSNLEPQLTSTRYDVKEAKQELLDVMGLPVQLSIDVKGDLSSFNIQSQQANNEENEAIKSIDRQTPLVLETDSVALKKAMDLRGDLRVLDLQKQLQGKQLDAQRSSYLPTVFAQYGLNWTASQPGTPVFFGDESNRARSQTLTVGVQLPIFQGLSRNVAIQRAKIQIKDTELQQYQAKQTANKEIFTAQQNVREALEISEGLQKALKQAERGYERAKIRFQNGVGSQQELNDAELQLRQAEINYAQMVSGYLSAKAQYDQATGQVPFVGKDIQEIKENIELK
ncbi:TolC family protein [Gracilimonas tropica]|uniref:TolC family protein n=1 Tax=Gracilimonas tropica TaxID=454600 RepID=UPI0003A423E5|nr:TolC family protein [Gracilimonas tropica]